MRQNLNKPKGDKFTLPNYEEVWFKGSKVHLHELLERLRIHYAARNKKEAIIEAIKEVLGGEK